MPTSTPPPLPGVKAASGRGISPRKVVLSVILAGSIVFFFLILLAGGVALLREGSLAGHAGLSNLLLTGKRLIMHHPNPHHSNPHHSK